MIILLMALLSMATMAEEFVVEKTYPRGNTHCGVIQKKRIHFQIRGISKFTIDTVEKDWGEYAFYVVGGKHFLLPINKLRMDSFQFLNGKSSHCSKTHGYMIDDKTLAVLFLKENKPFHGKLTIQLFDTQKIEPGEVIETEYMTNKIVSFPNGFAFPSLPEILDIENGKVSIEGTSYLYQNRNIVPWVSYTKTGFEVRPTLTYSKSIWKRFFKTEKEFTDAFEWDPSTKQFKRTILYTAFNHGVKKKCILPVEKRQQLTGLENWICR